MHGSDNELRLIVNGQEQRIAASTLEELLSRLGIAGNAVVAELNAVFVSPENFSSASLADGDRIELVRFVGGG